MTAICRVSDTGSHGGSIITGSPNINVNGLAVARNGDTYDCEIHGPNALIASQTIIFANGLAIVQVGDSASCGSIMETGSPTVFIE